MTNLGPGIVYSLRQFHSAYGMMAGLRMETINPHDVRHRIGMINRSKLVTPLSAKLRQPPGELVHEKHSRSQLLTGSR